MKKLAKLAGTLPFAHLLGVKAAAPEEENDDDREKEKAKSKAESEDGDDEEKEEKKKDAKAEGDDKKPEDEGDDKEGKKAKGAKADDEDGDEMASAVAGERARCAAIMAHGINTGAVRQAAVLAFDTSMSADAAIASLDAAAEDRRASGGLAERMAQVNTPRVKPAAEAPNPNDPSAVAQMVLAAGAKARGGKA
jgi:hypothetical protein